MNAESENIQNFLFVPKSQDYAQEFYKLCLECTKQDNTVLLITRKPFDLLQLLSKEELNKEQLKKCIIMHFERIDDIVKKLLELHDWILLPVLVVIDLHSFLEDYTWQPREATLELIETSVPAIQPICLCIATLFNYMTSVEHRLLALKSTAVQNLPSVAHSIVLLGEHGENFSQTQLELLINLYFYDGTAFDNYDEMRSNIVSTWQTNVLPQ